MRSKNRNTSEPIYSGRGIHKEYYANNATYEVLKGLDVTIHAGEIVSIVGMSGVGKSTLLNILGLLDTPTSGVLRLHEAATGDGGRANGRKGTGPSFEGTDLASLGPRRRANIRNRQFGFVFQFYHLLPDLNVLENVLLPTMIRYRTGEFGARKAELRQRAEGLLEKVGILDRKDFAPTRLSGGERQRAAIARALMNEPRIVFCDEPTGNLDTTTGERIHRVLLELNETTGTAFVVVTHDQGLAGLAHRRLVMRDGLFVEE